MKKFTRNLLLLSALCALFNTNVLGANAGTCAVPTALTLGTATASLTLATAATNPPAPITSTTNLDEGWYSFTAAADYSMIDITAGTSGKTYALQVFDNTASAVCGNSVTAVYSNASILQSALPSYNWFATTVGHVYYARVYCITSASQAVTLTAYNAALCLTDVCTDATGYFTAAGALTPGNIQIGENSSATIYFGYAKFITSSISSTATVKVAVPYFTVVSDALASPSDMYLANTGIAQDPCTASGANLSAGINNTLSTEFGGSGLTAGDTYNDGGLTTLTSLQASITNNTGWWPIVWYPDAGFTENNSDNLILYGNTGGSTTNNNGGTLAPYMWVAYTGGCTTPGAPTSVAGSATSQTAANLSWAAGEAGSSSVTYNWYVGTSSAGDGPPVSTQTFNYVSNATQTWTVPTGVTSATVKMWGGGGGSGYYGTTNTKVGAGCGAYMTGTLTGLTTGEVITLYVPSGGGYNSGTQSAAAGGWPGGGTGTADATYGEYSGGGGGYAAVAYNGTLLAVAGGGGGGGSYTNTSKSEYGGGGGATSGVAGQAGDGTTGGGAGTISGGGAAGTPAGSATAGTSLQGGAGGTLSGDYAGGGGGGGYFGGGGGNEDGGGGGGGSSYPASSAATGGITFTVGTNTAGTEYTSDVAFGFTAAPGSPTDGVGGSIYEGAGGNGQIVISWTDPNLVASGTGVSGTTATTSALSCGTTYYLTVNATTSCNSTTSPYTVSSAFTTTSCCAPSAPTLTATANGSSSSPQYNASGATVNLSQTTSGGTNCGSWTYAWTDGSGNYWNGSAFASATPVYSASYSSIAPTISANTTYTVYVEGTGSGSSLANSSITVDIITLPTLTAEADGNSGSETIATNVSSNLTANTSGGSGCTGTIQFAWSNNGGAANSWWNGTNFTGASASYSSSYSSITTPALTTGTTFTCYEECSTINGTNSSAVTVNIGSCSAPTLNAEANGSTGTSGNPVLAGGSTNVTLTANATGGNYCNGNGAWAYAWTNGTDYWDGIAFESATAVYNTSYGSITYTTGSGSTTTTYTVTAQCSNNSGCASTGSNVVVQTSTSCEAPSLTAEANGTSGTATITYNATVALTSNAAGGGDCSGTFQYAWSNDGGTTFWNGSAFSGGANYNTSYSSISVPNVTTGATYTAYVQCSANSGCNGSSSVTVNIGTCSAPSLTAEANGTAGSLSACSGTSITLTANPSGGAYCSGNYAWSNDGGTTFWNGTAFSGGANYSASYSSISFTSGASSTTYTCYVQCTSPSCNNSGAVAVNVTAPATPVFANYGGSNQLAFNNSQINSSTPYFRASATAGCGGAYNSVVIDINTNATFTGTDYQQTFSGSYTSGTAYDFEFTNGIPATDGVTYYVRIKAAADGGTNYSAWSSPTYSFTYMSASLSPNWLQQTQAQFSSDALSNTTSNVNYVSLNSTTGNNTITNGSFETGTTSGWTLSDSNIVNTSVNDYTGIATATTPTSMNGFTLTPPSPSPVTNGTYCLVMCNDADGFKVGGEGEDAYGYYIAAQSNVNLTGVTSLTFSQDIADWNQGGCSGYYCQTWLEVVIDPNNSTSGAKGYEVYQSPTWSGTCGSGTTYSSGPENQTINLTTQTGYPYGNNCSVKFVWRSYIASGSSFTDAPTVYIDNIVGTAPATGTITSTAYNLSSVQGATGYGTLVWNQTQNGGTISFAVQQYTGGAWANISGYTAITSSTDGSNSYSLSGISNTIDSIRVVATLTGAGGNSPYLNSFAIDAPVIPPTLTAEANGTPVSIGVSSGTAVTLTANPSGGSNCSNYFQYAWYNGTDYWNGTAFASSTPVYSSSYTSIGITPASTATYTVTANCNAVTTPVSTSSVIVDVCVEGTYSVGPTGNYSNITAAIAAISSATICSDIVFQLQPTYTSSSETFPLTINALTYGTGGPFTVTFEPGPTVTSALTTSGSESSAALITLNGAHYIIFDGRPGGSGTSSYWTIANTSASAGAAAIQFNNGADYDGLNYLGLQSANEEINSGTVALVAGTVSNTYDTIENCNIGSYTASGYQYVGICAYATYPYYNSSIMVENNQIHDFIGTTTYGIFVTGTGTNSDYGDTWTITGNSLYSTINNVLSDGSVVGINFTPSGTSGTSGSNTISNNTIGGSAAVTGGSAPSGTWVTSANSSNSNSFMGIQVQAKSATISGNYIGAITEIYTEGQSGFTGIYVPLGFSGGSISITGNTVGSTEGPGNQYFVNLSTTSITPGTGSKTFTVPAGLPYVVGDIVQLTSPGTLGSDYYSEYMLGNITSYSGTSMTVNVTMNLGATAESYWTLTLASGVLDQAQYMIEGIWVSMNGTTSTCSVTNNTVANLSQNNGNSFVTAGIITQDGIFTVSGNTVYNLTNPDAVNSSQLYVNTYGSVVGISQQGIVAGDQAVSNNTVYNLYGTYTGTSANAIYGLDLNGDVSGTTYLHTANANLVYGLGVPNTATGSLVYGIFMRTGVWELSNNIVQLGINGAGSSITGDIDFEGITDGESGSSATSSFPQKIYNNTINIDGTGVGGGSVNTFGFRRNNTNGSPKDYVDVRNNIFVNDRSNTSSGSNYNFSIGYESNTDLTASSLEDYNDFYGAGTGYVLAYVGANETSISALQSATSSSFDVHSITSNPSFISPDVATPNLGINSGSPVIAAGTASTLSGVTTDFYGATRSTPVTIGAITYSDPNDAGITAIPSATDLCPGVQSVTATIYNYGSSTLTSVKVNWSVDGNSQTQASFTGLSVASGSSITETLGTYDFVSGSNTIVAATTLPNGTTDGNPSNDSYTTTVSAGFPSTVYVGSGSGSPSYATFSALFAAINTSTVAQNITVLVQGNTTEPSTPTFLNAVNYCSGGPYWIYIQPATSSNYTISGTSGSSGLPGMIGFSGASYVYIDGEYNGDGNQHFTFTNSSASYPVISFISNASYITIKNSVITGSVNSSSYGLVTIGAGVTSGGATGNSNLKIAHNTIGNSSSLLYNIIYSNGISGSLNTTDSIIGNSIFNFQGATTTAGNGINVTATGNGGNWVIDSNSIYNTLTNSSSEQTAINFTPGSSANGSKINHNYIGGSAAQCGGSAGWINSWSPTGTENNIFGVVLNTGTVTVDSNLIKRVWVNDDYYSGFIGIQTNSSTAATIVGNTMGGTVEAVFDNSPSTSDILEVEGGAGSSYPGFIFGVWTEGTGATVVDSNTFNIMVQNGATKGGQVESIFYESSGTATIMGNVTNHDECWGIGFNSFAFQFAPAASSSGNVIANNVIEGLLVDNTGSSGDHEDNVAIFVNITNGLTVSGSIYGNIIWDVITNDVDGSGEGIEVQMATASGTGAGNWNIYNNMIYLNNQAQTTDAEFDGIDVELGPSSTTNVFYNSVWIDGTNSGSTNSSSALLRLANESGSAAGDVFKARNNILINTRTGGSFDAAIDNYGSSSSIATNFSSNYNFLFNSAGSKNYLGYWKTSTESNLSAWQGSGASDGDANSYTATYTTGASNFSSGLLNPTDLFNLSVPADLSINTSDGQSATFVADRATPITTANGYTINVPVDINGTTRNTTTPDIGAYEFISCTTPVIASNTPSNPTTCGGSNGSITFTGLSDNVTYAVTYDFNSSPVSSANYTSTGTGTLVIGSLAAGAYTNFVLTIGSCNSTAYPSSGSITLSNPASPSTPTGLTNQTTCGNGNVTFTVIDPGAGYTVEWSTNGTSNNDGTGAGGSGNLTKTKAVTVGTPITEYALISNNTTSCVSAWVSATGTANANPTVYTLTGGTNCGSSTPSLSGSDGSTTSYQLVLNGSTNIGSSINGSDLPFNFPSQTTPGTYTVVATGPGGCTETMTGSTTVNANPGAVTITPSSATYSGTAVSLTASASGSPTFTWSPASGLNTTSGATVLASPTSTTTYTATATLGSCSTSNIVVVTYSICTPGTWLGGASGAPNDWFTPGNWSCNTVPTNTIDVTIPGGLENYPQITGAPGLTAYSHDIIIQSGATVDVLGVNGVTLQVDGNYTDQNDDHMGSGEVVFQGSAAQTITGANYFTNMLVNNVHGVTIASGSTNMQYVSGTLVLQNGTLTTNGNLTITSTASGTGMIDNFSSGNNGGISGNLTVQRYVVNPSPSGVTGVSYYYIGAPVGGANITQWNGEFTNNPINGAQNNSAVVPTSSCSDVNLQVGSPYGGLFEYEENTVTSCNLAGWHTIFSGTIPAGQGYAGIISNGTTIALTGSFNADNISSPALTVTSTNETETPGFGWNLIANPFAAPVHWLSVASGNNNLAGTAYTYITSGSLAGTYNAVNELTYSINGLDELGSSEAAWVEATSNNSTVTFSKTMAADGANGFLRTTEPWSQLVTMNVAGNGYNDQLLIAFGADFTNGYNPGYSAHFLMGRAVQPAIYATDSSIKYSILAIPLVSQSERDVPVGFLPGTSGSFTFTFDLNGFDPTALVILEDLKAHVLQNLLANPIYNFTGDVGDDTSRFILHFVPAALFSSTASDCKGSDGSIQANLGLYNVDSTVVTWTSYTLLDSSGAVLSLGANVNGNLNINNLPGGVYQLQLTYGSYMVTEQIDVTGVTPVAAKFLPSGNDVLPGAQVQFTNSSTGATTYDWSFGDGDTSSLANPAHSYTDAGVYPVILTASNDSCTNTYQQTITVEKVATGISNVNDASVSITGYADAVSINFHSFTQLQEVTLNIYDVTGRKIITTETISTGDSHHVVNVGEIASGYYFVVLTGQDYEKAGKVFLTNGN